MKYRQLHGMTPIVHEFQFAQDTSLGVMLGVAGSKFLEMRQDAADVLGTEFRCEDDGVTLIITVQPL